MIKVMTKTMKYAAAIVISAICLGAVILCTRGKEGAEIKASSPEAAVEAFTRHIAAGEFKEAFSLCDTTSMKDYIMSCIEGRERLEKKDSSALRIASSLLSGADFKVVKTEKAEDGRMVYYNIGFGGHTKSKVATVGKEEGEWKVKMITDAI